MISNSVFFLLITGSSVYSSEEEEEEEEEFVSALPIKNILTDQSAYKSKNSDNMLQHKLEFKNPSEQNTKIQRQQQKVGDREFVL